MIDLTDEERRAIASLKRLANRWPKTLWLFAAGAGDSMAVMKLGPNGHRVHRPGGEVDPDYIVDDIEIPNDGGDW